MDETLLSTIRRHGVERFSDILGGLALRSIRLRSKAPGSHMPGTSRIGGLPDLPVEVEWPHAERPLAFLAQVNLSEIAPLDPTGLLPKHGILYFFADDEEPWGFEPADSNHWRVIYRETVPTTGPTVAPADLAPESLLKESGLTFESEWTLPPYESPMTDGLEMTDEEEEAYLEADGEEPIHRLFGHPQQVQGFVPYEIAMATSGVFNGSWDSPEAEKARATYDEWVLLLQLDSDWETNGMMWGDVGRLYFYIRKEDLAKRCFDRVWLMMQCS